jgi:DNA-binding transcriptional ArsR family regulator
MIEVYRLENIEQLKAISKPIRWRMLVLLIENSMTGSQLGRALKIPRNITHYHLKILEKSGLIVLYDEKPNKGIIEKYYRAIAKRFLTDHLIDRNSPLPSPNNHAAEKGSAIRDMLKAISEQARMDIHQATPEDMAIRGNFYYQYEVDLTYEESKVIEKELREVRDHMLILSEDHQKAVDQSDCQHLRYTVFKTPVPIIDPNLLLEESD